MCGHPAGTYCANRTRGQCDEAQASYKAAHAYGPDATPLAAAEVSTGGFFNRRRAKAAEERNAAFARDRQARIDREQAARQARYDALLRRDAREEAAAAMHASGRLSASVQERLWHGEVAAAHA